MTIEIAVLIGLAGAGFGLYQTLRAHRQDNAKEGKQDGVILTEIGYIKSGIDDIKRKQSTQDAEHVKVISRLTAVEASAKQAHKRIDTIAGVEGR